MKKKIALVVRILMGLVFVGSGIAFFMVTPPPMQGPIADFFNGLVASKYFLYLLKGTEITCGLLLISGFYVPLALTILAPIILNIFMVHLMLAPEGLPLACVLVAAEIYLAFFSEQYSPVIKSLFRAKA